MIPTAESLTATSEFCPDAPEILALSHRYGEHLERLSRPAKYALIACLALEAGSWSSGFPSFPSPLTLPQLTAELGRTWWGQTRPLLYCIDLSDDELAAITAIASEIQEIDESQQQRFICCLSAQLIAGLHAPDYF